MNDKVPLYEKKVWETEINVKRPKIRLKHEENKVAKRFVELLGRKLSQTEKEAVKLMVSH